MVSKTSNIVSFKEFFVLTLEILTQTSHLFAICPDINDELFMWVLFNNDHRGTMKNKRIVCAKIEDLLVLPGLEQLMNR